MSFHPYTRSARARHACALAAATCLASLLSGCGNSEMAAVPSTHRAGGGSLELLSAPVSLQGVSVADSVVSMDVAVDVVVVGFPRETAQQLADALTPDSMLQVPYSDPRTLSTGTFAPGWFAPRAIYRVTYAPQSLADAYHDALQVGADGKHSDGNAAEAWLTQALADAGFIADPARPAVVLLHQGNASPGYAYDYGNGWLAPVRVLGAGNLIVMDLSAEADPFVGTGQPYGAPLALEDPSVVDALRAGARDAAAFRLMQGTLYVPSMKPCHALTVLAAKRMTATDGAPGYPVDAAQLERTFAALTGDPVFVDVKEITLPIDDPALDAFTRLISDGVPVNGTPARPDQVAREWIERNWASYHVPHEGCEEYLTLALSGDAADVQGRGTAEFDDGGGHRFAYTMVTNACALEEQLGVDVLGGCGSRVGVDEYRVPNALITHESGHLFGLRHPHDIEFPGGGGRQNMTFSSLATSMSYEEDDRMLGFGAIDQNNFRRNRAATALWMAERAGLTGSPAYAGAIASMQQGAWNTVTSALRGFDLTPLTPPAPITLPPSCTFMPAGSTVQATPCAGCTASDEALSVDGKFDTFATLAPATLEGGGALRATAPAGTVFAGGSIPGAFIDRPTMVDFQIGVRTYLAGQLQEDLPILTGDLGSAEDHQFYGARTAKPFDAIELYVDMTPGTGDVHVEEFCSEGSNGG